MIRSGACTPRAETLVLVHLRTVFQRERGTGETSARVDVEELEQTVLSYFDPEDHNLARGQQEVRTAVQRLASGSIFKQPLQRPGRRRSVTGSPAAGRRGRYRKSSSAVPVLP
jgi:hypothetical protein